MFFSTTVGNVALVSSSSSFRMSNQYAPSNLVLYFSLSVVMDVFCVLVTSSMLENDMHGSFFCVTRDLYSKFNLKKCLITQ